MSPRPINPDQITADDLPVDFGRYTLTQILGEGGMARVFLGNLTGKSGFTKKVAIKVLHATVAARGEQFLETLANEARLGGLLSHPNVVNTYDFGDVNGQPFIAMEYIDGLGLDELLEQVRRPPPAIAVEICLQIAAGLEFAHNVEVDGTKAELVHRDLKPSNVIISCNGQVKLMDFGIAKATNMTGGLTGIGMTKGTPPFMSPEQMAAEDLDRRSDVFALGSLIYEVATGYRLFSEATISAVIAAVMDVDRTLWETKRLDVLESCVPDLRPIVARCLRQDREARYVSAREVANDLKRVLRGMPMGPGLEEYVQAVIAGDVPPTTVEDDEYHLGTQTAPASAPLSTESINIKFEPATEPSVAPVKAPLHEEEEEEAFAQGLSGEVTAPQKRDELLADGRITEKTTHPATPLPLLSERSENSLEAKGSEAAAPSQQETTVTGQTIHRKSRASASRPQPTGQRRRSRRRKPAPSEPRLLRVAIAVVVTLVAFAAVIGLTRLLKPGPDPLEALDDLEVTSPASKSPEVAPPAPTSSPRSKRASGGKSATKPTPRRASTPKSDRKSTSSKRATSDKPKSSSTAGTSRPGGSSGDPASSSSTRSRSSNNSATKPSSSRAQEGSKNDSSRTSTSTERSDAPTRNQTERRPTASTSRPSSTRPDDSPPQTSLAKPTPPVKEAPKVIRLSMSVERPVTRAIVGTSKRFEVTVRGSRQLKVNLRMRPAEGAWKRFRMEKSGGERWVTSVRFTPDMLGKVVYYFEAEVVGQAETRTSLRGPDHPFVLSVQ